MERLMFVWDELDDWTGIARHYLAGAVDSFPIRHVPADALVLLASLPWLALA